MRLEIYPLRSNLETLKLNVPYSKVTVLNDLRNEIWTDHRDSEFKANQGHCFRSVLPSPQSNILKEILDYMCSDKIKKQVIDTLYKDFPHVSSLWEGWTIEQMDQNTVWGGQYLKDSPGFYLDKHLDTRLQVATGLIYFTEHDDTGWSTVYYSDKTGSDELRITNNFCEGVLHVNEHNTWHEGYNRTNQDRYLMIIGLLINV